MTFLLRVPVVVGNVDGVWESEIEPEDVRRFGSTAPRRGDISVVGLVGRPRVCGSYVEFDANCVNVLNIGGTTKCVLIALEDEQEFLPPVHAVENGVPALVAREDGDLSFLGECRRHFSKDMYALAELFLSKIREKHSGSMREGLARKWVNYPDNFIAITIQNRDQSMAVYAKGDADRLAGFRSIEVRPDRPGYVRFKLYRATQLGEALQVIEASARV
jgi:hypothetical protein